MTIPDPGFGLPRDEARAARLAAWSRPATPEERAASRESRQKSWLRGIADGRRAAAAGQLLVTPAGRASGDGTVDRPWDLASALASTRVRPGDTIWVSRGAYEGVFRSSLFGERQNEITVRALPGERAVIDGSIRIETGGHVIFRDFEVVNSRLKRRTELPGSDPADVDPHDGFYVTAPYIKLVNNVVHDTPQGIGIWASAVGSEVYGNIVYNNGWTGPDRTHGHGIYTQNNDPSQPKHIEHNVFANNYSYNVHCYGGPGSSLLGFSFDENVAVNRRWLAGGETSAGSVLLRGNHLIRESFELGYGGRDNADIVVWANMLVDGPMALKRWESFDVRNNTVAATGADGISVEFESSGAHQAAGAWDGTKYLLIAPEGRNRFRVDGKLLSTFSSWVANTGFDGSGQVIEMPPSEAWTYVLPNRYEAGRGLIVVYNWNQADEVWADVGSVLEVGDRFTISNCLNPAESTTGIFSAAPIRLPMAGWTSAPPLNDEVTTVVSPFPRFGVFLLRRERRSADLYASDLIPRPRDRN